MVAAVLIKDLRGKGKKRGWKGVAHGQDMLDSYAEISIKLRLRH